MFEDPTARLASITTSSKRVYLIKYYTFLLAIRLDFIITYFLNCAPRCISFINLLPIEFITPRLHCREDFFKLVYYKFVVRLLLKPKITYVIIYAHQPVILQKLKKLESHQRGETIKHFFLKIISVATELKPRERVFVKEENDHVKCRFLVVSSRF